MAWYHVGSCDCPIGCCDCGTTYTHKVHYYWRGNKEWKVRLAESKEEANAILWDYWESERTYAKEKKVKAFKPRVEKIVYKYSPKV